MCSESFQRYARLWNKSFIIGGKSAKVGKAYLIFFLSPNSQHSDTQVLRNSIIIISCLKSSSLGGFNFWIFYLQSSQDSSHFLTFATWVLLALFKKPGWAHTNFSPTITESCGTNHNHLVVLTRAYCGAKILFHIYRICFQNCISSLKTWEKNILNVENLFRIFSSRKWGNEF